MRDSSWRAFWRVRISDASGGLEERMELISWICSSLCCLGRFRVSRGGGERGSIIVQRQNIIMREQLTDLLVCRNRISAKSMLMESQSQRILIVKTSCLFLTYSYHVSRRIMRTRMIVAIYCCNIHDND